MSLSLPIYEEFACYPCWKEKHNCMLESIWALVPEISRSDISFTSYSLGELGKTSVNSSIR